MAKFTLPGFAAEYFCMKIPKTKPHQIMQIMQPKKEKKVLKSTDFFCESAGNPQQNITSLLVDFNIQGKILKKTPTFSSRVNWPQETFVDWGQNMQWCR